MPAPFTPQNTRPAPRWIVRLRRKRWFRRLAVGYLPTMEDRRRAFYLVLTNLLLFIGSLSLVFDSMYHPVRLVVVMASALVNLVSIALIYNGRYRAAVSLFVFGEPILALLTVAVSDLDTLQYLVIVFLAVSLFLNERRSIWMLGVGLMIMTGLIALFSYGLPQFALVDRADAFLFVQTAILMVIFTGAVAIGDLEQIRAQHRRMADLLAQSQMILNNMPGVLTLYDPDLRAVEIHASESIARHDSVAAFHDTPLEQHIHPDALAKVRAELGAVRDAGQPRIYEARGLSGRWYEHHAAPLLDERGQVQHIVQLSIDTTDRKAQETELKRMNEDLNNFAYVVSHDLKAPLRGIHTLAGWLNEDHGAAIGADGQELITMMQSRLLVMEGMIDGVLEYARIGRSDAECVPTDVNEIVRQAADLVIPQGKARLHIDTPLPTIMTDPTRLRQVFQNLLDNAVKYCDKPLAEIHIGCEALATEWRFSVRDNGIGIAESQYDRIFQIFQTLAPREEKGSTGIGLAILKRIIEQYGGKIEVESIVGEGSTFYFTLPRA
ncbi:MAG: ATP-binding protein [bacterium]|nr:ATP-binding protein [bacterium]